MFCENTEHVGKIALILSAGAELHRYEIFCCNRPNRQHVGIGFIIFREAGKTRGIGFRPNKVLIQPSIWKIIPIPNPVDNILHNRCRLNHGIYIRCHISESIINKDGSTADQNHLGGHILADLFPVFLCNFFQIGVYIFFGKFNLFFR